MDNYFNNTGLPLSGIDWLKVHHLAKSEERKQFLSSILNGDEEHIVDLGCGPGLWMNMLSDRVGPNCKLTGIDCDEDAIFYAKKNSRSWLSKSEFHHGDLFTNLDKVENADLILAFNVFPYLDLNNEKLDLIKSKLSPNGRLVIRQYDGANLRFGPIASDIRIGIENSLFSSTSKSELFRHYDLDRSFELVSNANFENKNIYFEKFEKVSPYSKQFKKYFLETLKWTDSYINNQNSTDLAQWINKYLESDSLYCSYFTEIDLVAVLS